VNGKFTSGENIGDLGVAVAYDALQMYLKDKGNPGLISGFHSGSEIFHELGNSLENEGDRSVYGESGKNRSALAGSFQSIWSVGKSGCIYQSI
jgi:hypothetical protein